MKTISLLKTTIKNERNATEFSVSTLEIIVAALDQSPKEGLDMSTVRARLRFDKAIAKLEPDAIALELDEADFKTVKEAMEPTRWLGRNIVVNTLVSELADDEPVVREMKAV